MLVTNSPPKFMNKCRIASIRLKDWDYGTWRQLRDLQPGTLVSVVRQDWDHREARA